MTDTTPEPDTAADPPWGSDFTAEAAWREIRGLRETARELRRNKITPDQRQALDHYATLVDAGMSDLDRAHHAEAAAYEQMDRLRTRAGRAAARAAAADLGLPETALGDLDVAGYVDDDGEVYTEALRADLAGLLGPEPGRQGGVRAPRPFPGQGVAAAGPSLEDQLAEAKRRGDWQAVLALENRKLRP